MVLWSRLSVFRTRKLSCVAKRRKGEGRKVGEEGEKGRWEDGRDSAEGRIEGERGKSRQVM